MDSALKTNSSTTRRLCLSAAVLGALLLASSCGLIGSAPTAASPAQQASSATGRSEVTESRHTKLGQPAACVKEGESCNAPTAKCCAGYVCAGIGSSTCMPQF